MSHELRTPLNAIIGFSDMMREQVFGPLGTPQYVEYADDIARSGEPLLAPISDRLDLSKAEAGALPLHPAPIDPSPVLQDGHDRKSARTGTRGSDRGDAGGSG